MNIGSKQGYPASALSNFAPHPFTMDGVECNSMEGFLQSLKFKNTEMQKHVCTLTGKVAKFKGKGKKWWRDQKLYWLGQIFERESKEYQELLDRAYLALFENTSFKKALKATGSATFSHSIGKNNPKQTVLTEQEFCSRLRKLRELIYD